MFIVSEMKYWTEVSEELMARKAEIQIGTRQVFEFDELVGTIEEKCLIKKVNLVMRHLYWEIYNLDSNLSKV
ncbi:MAG: hypothetical protein A2071_08825 [Bacteroidetes bacterium GWC1_47_7]|nr:MAG: hypothetical protein A2071_08825 [Bacteroidetes bacterium GWC1_47_7]